MRDPRTQRTAARRRAIIRGLHNFADATVDQRNDRLPPMFNLFREQLEEIAAGRQHHADRHARVYNPALFPSQYDPRFIPNSRLLPGIPTFIPAVSALMPHLHVQQRI